MKTKKRSSKTICSIVAIFILSTVALFIVNRKQFSNTETILPSNDIEYPTPSLISADFKFKVPSGWKVEKTIQETTEFIKNEVVSFKNGNYELDIGGGSTGYSRCDEYYGQNIDKDLKKLTNEQLGNQIFRQTPSSGLTSNGKITLTFCSQLKGLNGMTYGSKVGEIRYSIPEKYDISILKQMDNIVESINW